MCRHNQNQLEFENFGMPFFGKLQFDNPWVKLAKVIPRDEFERSYSKSLKRSGFGPPAKSVRVALGSLIIKKHFRISGEETVEQVRKNSYLQYFFRFQEIQKKSVCPTMFILFQDG